MVTGRTPASCFRSVYHCGQTAFLVVFPQVYQFKDAKRVHYYFTGMDAGECQLRHAFHGAWCDSSFHEKLSNSQLQLLMGWIPGHDDDSEDKPMKEWKYPGARWWKFDFHTHTPASHDFLQGCESQVKSEVTPEFWLRKFMEAGIDCVAITDHNSGEWIDNLKQGLTRLAEDGNKPEWYRPINLFPGVEISTNGGTHLLAIFDPVKKTSDIDSLLGTVGFGGTKGTSDGVTTKSLTEVIDEVEKAGAIPIPAHVDKEKGLFQLSGNTLEEVLEKKNIHAMELCSDGFNKPQIYKKKKLQWTEVRGSDTHNFRSNQFGDFTWLKMDKPSIEGVKLALLDGPASVNRETQAVPNRHSEYVIEEITVENARYMGRGSPLTCRFSPFLNTIIGGRGSGKSTLLEFMRFVLRREKEIPKPLIQESEKYFQTGDEYLLLDESRLSLIYRKGSTCYRLNWSAKADSASLEAEIENQWKAEQGEIRSLFPAYIYSQKQIFTLAQEPDALLDIIDRDVSVHYEDLEQERTRLVNCYRQFEQKSGELNEKIAEKNKRTGLLNDTTRQIKQIEGSGHKEVLRNYRLRQRQLEEIKKLEKQWKQMANRLRESRDEIAPVSFDEQEFSSHQDILQVITDTEHKWKAIYEAMGKLTEESQDIVSDWQQRKTNTEWMKTLRTDVEKYEQLRAQLEKEGIDPGKYPSLLQQQALNKKELADIKGYENALKKLDADKRQILTELQQNRENLTENRKLFLASVLKNNQSVVIKVQPFGQVWGAGVETKIRRLLQCEGQRFEKDLEALKQLYQGVEKITAVQAIKKRVSAIRKGDKDAKDKRFSAHIKNLPRESNSNLMCWFPQDALEITFGDNQSIRQGSPGQKTAALLAFILSYGAEPLLLDQPEDDLDNELIYDLIVKQLRETKSNRQIIVVTHNANIVVNGDAEMVLPLVASGQSYVMQPASIQDAGIREKICAVLEGGQKAFEQRYKRIHLED